MNTLHTRRLKRKKHRRALKAAGHKLTPPKKKRGTEEWVRFDKQWYKKYSKAHFNAVVARDKRQREKTTV